LLLPAATHVFAANNVRVALNADDHGMGRAEALLSGMLERLPQRSVIASGMVEWRSFMPRPHLAADHGVVYS
jgi:hypothetical protein